MASTRTLRHTPDGLATAAALLQDGGLVAFATETVYGLGADATNDRAVARIFAAKGRPSFNPLIVHLPDIAQAAQFGMLSDQARQIAEAFWPGPLTLVLPLPPDHGLSPLVTAGLDSVAIRVPASAQAQALLVAVGRPIAAPPANPSGRLSPTRVDHVLAGLDGQIDAVLDGGPCAVGLESTILRTDPLVLLREGGVPTQDIETRLGTRLTHDTTPGRVRAPGQLASHYAPHAPVRLDQTRRHSDAILVGFGPIAGDLTLAADGDVVTAAANLFHVLHEADTMAQAKSARWIDVAPIPAVGLGRAIRDRLTRAAAPRP